MRYLTDRSTADFTVFTSSNIGNPLPKFLQVVYGGLYPSESNHGEWRDRMQEYAADGMVLAAIAKVAQTLATMNSNLMLAGLSCSKVRLVSAVLML